MTPDPYEIIVDIAGELPDGRTAAHLLELGADNQPEHGCVEPSEDEDEKPG